MFNRRPFQPRKFNDGYTLRQSGGNLSRQENCCAISTFHSSHSTQQCKRHVARSWGKAAESCKIDAKEAKPCKQKPNTVQLQHKSRTPNRDEIVTGSPRAAAVPCAFFSSPNALARCLGLYSRSKARVDGRCVVYPG